MVRAWRKKDGDQVTSQAYRIPATHHVKLNIAAWIKDKAMADFDDVKQYVLDLQLSIVSEDADEELVVVEDEERGIKNLIIDCEDPILIFEQMIMPVPSKPGDMYRRLLQMNRSIVHGAFALDEEGTMVLFRDTLQLENLDLNEMDGTIEALSLALAEFAEELITFHHQ